MEKTSKPIVAGALNIITGALGLLGAYGIIFFIITKDYSVATGANVFGTVSIPIVLLPAILTTALAVLPLTGGAHSLQRKSWGLMLAGSIIAILIIPPLGILATILTVSSKNEFE